MTSTKTFKVILTVSVLLNLFFLALVGGHFLKRSGGGEHRPSIELASGESQSLVKQSMKKMRLQSKEMHKESRALRREMQKIMSADDFDAKAYVETSEQLRDVQGKMHALFSSSMLELAEKLPVEDRKNLSKKLIRGNPMYHKKHRGKSHANDKGGKQGEKGYPVRQEPSEIVPFNQRDLKSFPPLPDQNKN